MKLLTKDIRDKLIANGRELAKVKGTKVLSIDETCLDTRLNDAGIANSDILDETRGLDKFEDGALLMLVDQALLKSKMPYSAPSPETLRRRSQGLARKAPITMRSRRSMF